MQKKTKAKGYFRCGLARDKVSPSGLQGAPFARSALSIAHTRPEHRADMGHDTDVNLVDIIKILRRRVTLIFAVMLMLMATACYYVSLIPAQYTATATVVMNNRSSKIADLQSLISNPLLGIPAADTSVLRTEMETISSPAMIQRVVEETGLMGVPEFNPAPGAEASQGFIALMDRIPQVHALAARLEHALSIARSWLLESRPNAQPLQRDARALVIARVQRALSATNDGVSYVLTIRFTSRDPNRAATIANAFATIYLREQENVKLATARNAAAWLGSRIQELENEVFNSEREFLNFRAKYGMTSENGAALLDQQISQMTTLLTTATAERLRADAALREAQQGRAVRELDGVKSVVTSPLIQGLRLEETRVGDEVAALAAQLAPGHPSLQNAKARLRDVHAKIDAEITRTVASVTSQYMQARKTESDLSARLTELQRQRSDLVGAELKLRALERVANANRSLYVSYLEKYKEITQQEHSQAPDARLLSSASVPLMPASPNRGMLLGAALVGSAGFACALALLLEWWRSGVCNLEILEASEPVRNFGLIPEVSRNTPPTDFLLKSPCSRYSEAVHRVCAALQWTGSDTRLIGSGQSEGKWHPGARVIVITSAIPGEGKSVFAASLARSMALTGRRALLVDCDLRNPSISKLFSEQTTTELSQFIVDPRGLTDRVALDPPSGLHYLAFRKEHHRIHAVLNSPLLPLMLQEARSQYDYIVIDTPPLVPVSDALVLSKLADTVLLVVRWERTPRAAVEYVRRLLRENGSTVSGVVLTRVNMRKHAHSHGGSSTYITTRYAGFTG
jgi:polysaccharide biosynthesis transport protein